MQRRAFHADEFRCARDVAREAADLGDQIVALEHLPRLAQRQYVGAFRESYQIAWPRQCRGVPLSASSLDISLRLTPSAKQEMSLR